MAIRFRAGNGSETGWLRLSGDGGGGFVRGPRLRHPIDGQVKFG
jgi:hypothetical protein